MLVLAGVPIEVRDAMREPWVRKIRAKKMNMEDYHCSRPVQYARFTGIVG